MATVPYSSCWSPGLCPTLCTLNSLSAHTGASSGQLSAHSRHLHREGASWPRAPAPLPTPGPERSTAPPALPLQWPLWAAGSDDMRWQWLWHQSSAPEWAPGPATQGSQQDQFHSMCGILNLTLLVHIWGVAVLATVRWLLSSRENALWGHCVENPCCDMFDLPSIPHRGKQHHLHIL